MIAIACDHAGIDLKPTVISVLDELGIPYKDFGTHKRESCDYPIYAARAAKAVASGECDLGIVLCGTGAGIGMAANKVKGIRCAHCCDTLTAEMTRRHNDANMLAMGAGITGVNLAKKMVEVFLATEFEGGRHQRRVSQLDAIEG